MSGRPDDAADRLLTAEEVADRYRGAIPVQRICKRWGRRERGAGVYGPPRVNTGTGQPLFRLADLITWEEACRVRHQR